MLLGDIARNNAQSFPSRTGLVDETGRFTWSETNSRVNSLANAMLSLGLRKGDRVCIICQNRHELAEFMFAVAKAGVIGAPVNYRLLPQHIARQINDCQPKMILVQDQFTPSLKSISSSIDQNIIFVSIGNSKAYPLNYESLVRDHPSTEPKVEVSEHDPHMIIYTSGTTGWVKGVVHTHASRLTHIMQYNLVTRAGVDDVFMNSLAMFAAGGQFALFLYSFAASKIVLLVDQPELWVKLAEKEKATVVSLSLIRYQRIRDYLDTCGRKYDLSSIRKVLMAAGAGQTGEMVRAITDYFKVKFSCKIYGSTEAGLAIQLLAEEMSAGLSPQAPEADVKKLDAMGRPRLCEMRVVDDNGQDVKPGEVGEIWLRGSGIMKGYWNQPDMNQQVFTDGWYHTNDMAHQDEDGLVYFVRRKDLMIKTGGFNVYPEELESVILKHSAVDNVAVFGSKDAKWGEAVTAAVVLREGQSATEEDIREHCRRYLSGFQLPKKVYFLDKLPTTETGIKVSRMELRRMFGGFEE